MQKRILVADDDYFFRSVLTQSIQDLGYAVESVEDGSLAQTQLSLGKFDLLISDIKTVKVSGIDLPVWTQQNHPAVPVVLMTGFYESMSEKIFMPFVTTKSCGTGIGLNLSRDIARRHGGDLIVELHQPHTTLSLRIPRR